MNQDEAARLRKEYEAEGLSEGQVADDPFTQFHDWLADATTAEIEELNTFVLATTDRSGRPSARALLMKRFSEEGILFFTDLHSRKSEELKENPQAAATFVWQALLRQVRFEGIVAEADVQVSDDYFATRPRGAQIAAHASNQSRVVASREVLEERFAELAARFGGDEIPRPLSWGGWLLTPDVVEFWQGQPNRFHDRVRYRIADGRWVKERLAP